MATAALVVGAAVFARPAAAMSCSGLLVPLAGRVASSQVVAIGKVTYVSDGEAHIAPAAYLKGPAQAGELVVKRSTQPAECPLATFAEGDQVLVMLSSGVDAFDWPDAQWAYRISGGTAVANGGAVQDVQPEDTLVSQIRSLTNQYAVPASSNGEGASIDWLTTVVPITGALLIVFIIGLYLMRIWHRIDPS
jgi:hypothetical protein